MDETKCNTLKTDLANQEEPQIVPIEKFFDGNDDDRSIGGTSDDHPGIEAFRSVLCGLLNRKDVEAVYAQIVEIDPGEESWPCADTVWIVGNISSKELQKAVKKLNPTEAGHADGFPAPESLEKHADRLSLLWWG